MDEFLHRGTVIEIFKGSSVLSVALDDGKKKNLELGNQGICCVSEAKMLTATKIVYRSFPSYRFSFLLRGRTQFLSLLVAADDITVIIIEAQGPILCGKVVSHH
uniref:Uncharacterized protein n=1 Tax=Solanum lycopersicum TaxID=4081 RepID=A0A3Q7EIY3_SOLLC